MVQLDLFTPGYKPPRELKSTQIEAYKTILRHGILQGRRMQVYEYLFYHGPASARTTLKALGLEMNHAGRFTELEYMQAVDCVGTEMSVTGHEVTLYDVSGRLPVKLKKGSKTSMRETQAVELLRQVYRYCYNQQAEIDLGLLHEIGAFLDLE